MISPAAPYQHVFTDEKVDPFRRKAEIACINNNLRLESDNLVYNAFGMAVAKYLGGDEALGLQFENLTIETDLNKMRIFR